MNQHETSLLATFKNVAAYGVKYTADFPAAGIGGQQFALINTAATQAGNLGATQTSGSDQKHSGVMSKASARVQLHGDLIAINTAAHTLALLNTPNGPGGKFPMPHNNGDQALLNAANAFATDAVAYTAQFVSVGLPANFLTSLTADIAAFQAAISTKGAGAGMEGGATGGIADTTHNAAIALHILDTIVRNTYKTNAMKLAEWIIASHVEKHTPVPRTKPAPPAA